MEVLPPLNKLITFVKILRKSQSDNTALGIIYAHVQWGFIIN